MIILSVLPAWVLGQRNTQAPAPLPRIWEGYYTPPMELPPVMAGNLGEFRSAHFHSGIDLKTNSVEGYKVMAVADGYISRMVINPSGYGRALYMVHPNGTTSVYAHLQAFTPELERYAATVRYQKRSNTLDADLPAGRFAFRKGDMIGLSGNTGSSTAPHLHFEIRHNATGRVIDPLAVGVVAVPDTIPPRITRLWFVGQDTLMHTPRRYPLIPVEITRTGNGEYRAKAELEIERGGYFALEAVDHKNGASNTMGIKYIRQELDGRPILEYRMDGFGFDQTKMVDVVSYYPLQLHSPYFVYAMGLAEGNKISLYPTVVSRGVVDPRDTLPHAVKFLLMDDNGNASTLSLTVRRKSMPERVMTTCTADGQPIVAATAPPMSNPDGIPVKSDQDFVCHTQGLKMRIPAGAVYEPFFFRQKRVEEAVLPVQGSLVVLSELYAIHNENTPLKNSIDVEITCVVPDALKSQAVIARLTDKNQLIYAGGRWENGAVKGQLRRFGNYCVVADTAAPVIRSPFATGASLAGASSITFTVADDFSGVASYAATIDGEWILLEEDTRGVITHRFDSRKALASGAHSLILKVSDRAGNSTMLETRFTL